MSRVMMWTIRIAGSGPSLGRDAQGVEERAALVLKVSRNAPPWSFGAFWAATPGSTGLAASGLGLASAGRLAEIGAEGLPITLNEAKKASISSADRMACLDGMTAESS